MKRDVYLEEGRDGYRKELVQIAAVAIAMIESLDRNTASRNRYD